MPSNRQDWWRVFNHIEQLSLHDKPGMIFDYVDYMLIRCLKMFEWKGLPEEIPADMMERDIMRYGVAGFFKDIDGKYHCIWGAVGSDLDQYYQPTKMIISNPAIPTENQKEYTRNEDVVFMRNDPLFLGLSPMFFNRASIITECDITLVFDLWKERLDNALVASSDSEKKDCEDYIKYAIDGKGIKPIVSQAFIDNQKQSHFEGEGEKSHSFKDIMELRQYYLASWYNDLGLQSNFNMKRESLNKEETGMNEDALLPLIDEMLKVRKEDAQRVNEMFGLNISVELSSSWKKVREDMKRTDEEKSEEVKDEVKEEVTDEVERNDN